MKKSLLILTIVTLIIISCSKDGGSGSGTTTDCSTVTNKAFVLSWPLNGLRMALRRYRYTCPVYHYNEADVRRLHEGLNIKSLEIIPMQGGMVSIARK